MYSDKATVAEPTQQKTPTTQPNSTQMLNNTYQISRSGSNSLPAIPSVYTPTLAVGVYKLIQPLESPMMLVDYEDFKLPEKLYDEKNVVDFSNRVFKTFNNIPSNLGVLLTGLKGTGKSIQLKHIAMNSNKPVIIVDRGFSGSSILDFLQKMPNPCVLLFDEFEKVYREDEAQESILPLLDGLSTGHHMFIFTVNGEVNEYLLNRPSRIRYVKEYKTLSMKAIEEIVDDLLDNKSKRDEVVGFFSVFEETSMDTIITFINECNMYPNDSIEYIASIFNIQNPLDIELNFSHTVSALAVSTKVRHSNEWSNIYDEIHTMWGESEIRHFCSYMGDFGVNQAIYNPIIRDAYERFCDSVVAKFDFCSKRDIVLENKNTIRDYNEFIMTDQGQSPRVKLSYKSDLGSEYTLIGSHCNNYCNNDPFDGLQPTFKRGGGVFDLYINDVKVGEAKNGY